MREGGVWDGAGELVKGWGGEGKAVGCGNKGGDSC